MRYLALGLLVLSGCIRLDGNLLSPGDEIGQYLLDDYQGEVDFRTPESLKVAQFTFVDLNSGVHPGHPPIAADSSAGLCSSTHSSSTFVPAGR